MTRPIAVVCALLMLLWLPAAARAVQEGPAATSEPADTAFEPLRSAVGTLKQSLLSRGGIREEDRPVLEDLRQRLTQFNAQYPDYPSGIAAELQLAVWLKEHERVDALYGSLIRLFPDRNDLGVAWIQYVKREEGEDRFMAVLSQMRADHPDDMDYIMLWAQHLKGKNRYAEAAAALEETGYEPADRPAAAVLHSECLFAEHQFDRALELLQAIPPDALAEDTATASRVAQALPAREQYVEFWPEEQALRQAEAEADDLPRAELITAKGRIVVELFENEAPNTVANFITLAESGFYDGTTFHRVLPNFMAQGGDPNTREGATGTPGAGSPGYRIADEHTSATYRRHFSGSLSMANSGPNTGGSQFFITHLPTPDLNGRHTVFGRVIEGLEVARAIEQDDELTRVAVLRTRDHEYVVQKIGDASTSPSPAPSSTGAGAPVPVEPSGAPSEEPESPAPGETVEDPPSP